MTQELIKPLVEDAHIVVAGAGSIGCFVGGLLAASGRRVTFLARPRIEEELSCFGLHLTDFAGLDQRLPPERFSVTIDPDILKSADVVLVTVKSGATSEFAKQIAVHCPAEAIIVSLQNGVENAAVLRSHFRNPVLGGMVAFNVVHMGEGRFHRGTSGQVVIEAGRQDAVALLQVQDLDAVATPNISGVQWGKLLINLNNALNALSGLPLREQLQSRAWRRILADQIEEALTILTAANIKPVPATPVPLRFVPSILRLPDAIFRVAAARMLKIDPQARSSMWEDLMRGRRTEIDYLQGAILHLANESGHDAPLTKAIIQLVNHAENKGQGSPGLKPEQILKPDFANASHETT